MVPGSLTAAVADAVPDRTGPDAAVRTPMSNS
jgi:hypothetical protein